MGTAPARNVSDGDRGRAEPLPEWGANVLRRGSRAYQRMRAGRPSKVTPSFRRAVIRAAKNGYTVYPFFGALGGVP